MKYQDEPMKSRERWLFCAGLVFGLAAYQMVDVYWLRPHRDSALRSYAASARECLARSEQVSADLASCTERQDDSVQSKLASGRKR